MWHGGHALHGVFVTPIPAITALQIEHVCADMDLVADGASVTVRTGHPLLRTVRALAAEVTTALDSSVNTVHADTCVVSRTSAGAGRPSATRLPATMGPCVVILALGCNSMLRFSRGVRSRLLCMPKGHLCVLSGEARYQWSLQHIHARRHGEMLCISAFTRSR
jgi:hypothetical protein